VAALSLSVTPSVARAAEGEATTGIGGAPRSPEERAAVGFAVLYRRGGATAWQKALSAD
jgi:hypothetical protein